MEFDDEELINIKNFENLKKKLINKYLELPTIDNLSFSIIKSLEVIVLNQTEIDLKPKSKIITLESSDLRSQKIYSNPHSFTLNYKETYSEIELSNNKYRLDNKTIKFLNEGYFGNFVHKKYTEFKSEFNHLFSNFIEEKPFNLYELKEEFKIIHSKEEVVFIENLEDINVSHFKNLIIKNISSLNQSLSYRFKELKANYPEIDINFSNRKSKIKLIVNQDEDFEKLLRYEDKLIPNYLDENYKWIGTVSSLLRFYNFCFKRGIVKTKISKQHKVVLKFGELYGKNLTSKTAYSTIEREYMRNEKEFDFLMH